MWFRATTRPLEPTRSSPTTGLRWTSLCVWLPWQQTMWDLTQHSVLPGNNAMAMWGTNFDDGSTLVHVHSTLVYVGAMFVVISTGDVSMTDFFMPCKWSLRGACIGVTLSDVVGWALVYLYMIQSYSALYFHISFAIGMKFYMFIVL